jgi:hypothetical protein
MMWGGGGDTKPTMIKGRVFNNQMVTFVDGSKSKLCQTKNGYGHWSMWMIWAVGDAIATAGGLWKQRK